MADTMNDQMKITVEPDGSVRVTVTAESGPGISMTVSTVVDWRTFCRRAWPIVQSYTTEHRDGIMDVLPPERFILAPVEE